MTIDEKICIRARDVIAVHGISALYFSNACLEEARVSGNNSDVDNWQKIIAAIRFFQLERPRQSEMN